VPLGQGCPSCASPSIVYLSFSPEFFPLKEKQVVTVMFNWAAEEQDN